MVEGLILKVAYLLSRHHMFGNSLSRWSVVLSALATGLASWRLFQSPVLALIQAGLGAGIVALVLWQAKRRRYLRFVPQAAADADPPGPQALASEDKVPALASGYFAVNNMRRYFVETAAQFQVFETRERVVMANVAPSRLLLLARTPEHEWGWWYTFFQPSMIARVETGQLCFGLRQRPALKIELNVGPEEAPEALFLSFDDEAARAVVWADLQFDSASETL